MDTLITILVSLILGFIQGLKKRNKKLNNEIKRLNLILEEKENETQKLLKKNRLKQFSSKPYIKGKIEKFEQELVYFYNDEIVNKQIVYMNYCFFNCIKYDFFDEILSLNCLNILIEAFEENYGNDSYQKININNRIYDYRNVDIVDAIKNLLVEIIDITKYEITVKEVYDAIKFTIEL